MRSTRPRRRPTTPASATSWTSAPWPCRTALPATGSRPRSRSSAAPMTRRRRFASAGPTRTRRITTGVSHPNRRRRGKLRLAPADARLNRAARRGSWPAMLSPSTLARLAPPLFVFLWATGFIAARLVIPYADPLTFLVLRYVLAAILLGLIALAARAPWPTAARGWRNGMIAGMLIHGGYLGAVFWSIKHGLPAGISALIAGLQPLVTGMLVGPLIGERVSARRWLGIAVGFLGTALVIAPKLGAAGGFSALPVTVCFLGTVSITLGTIWQKRTAAAVDLRTNAVAQFVGAALATLPVALILENGRLEPAPELFIGLTWSVVALSIGAIGLLLVLIRRGAVAGVAALLYLVPPVAALMAYGLFGEQLSPMQILGMLVAAAGVALASRG